MPAPCMPDDPRTAPPTRLEALLGGRRAAALVLLVALPLVSWAWIVVMARDMYGPMTGASAWMMTMSWDLPHLVLLWAMWAVMMAGMMLPSAAPLILFYGGMGRAAGRGVTSPQVYVLAAGYLAVWAAFSLGATALQRLLAGWLIVSPMMEVTTSRAAAALLAVAGIYQLTPLKRACLRHCQSPVDFLMHHWRRGTSGALAMGLEHGLYCVGCCWALMLLLFAGGVMNLTVIAALTFFVAFEKFAPGGARTTWASGALLVAAAIWVLTRS